MNGAGMERRLTDEQEAQIRILADNFDDLVAQRYRVLLEEVDALRAGWDIETRMRMDAMAERDSALARAEAAEAKLDEQIEAAIALRHDLDTLRDLYGAAEARIAAALEEHTPFGPVGMACPTCRSAVKYDGLGRCPTRAALTVEEPTDG